MPVPLPLPLPLPLKPAPAPADRGAQVSPQDLDVVQLEPLLCVVTDPMKSVTKLGRLACLQRVATTLVSAEEGASCWHRRLGLMAQLGLLIDAATLPCLFASRGIFTPSRSRFCSRRPSHASTATA